MASYEKYDKAVPYDKVSFVIASENNFSPASMMGHSFLKIEGKGKEHAFSFFAILENYGSYIATVFGQAKGVYGLTPYSYQLNQYINVEKRSLWEFELALTEAEKEQLKQEIWKYKNKEEKYKFVTYNCNSALIELLAKINKDFKIDTIKPWTTPVEYAKFLADTGKIKSISYIPAHGKEATEVKHILGSKPSTRISVSTNIDDTFIEFSPVYQDLRTIIDAYNNELETKMLAFKLRIGDDVEIETFDLIKLFSAEPLSKFFQIGYKDNSFSAQIGLGPGYSVNNFSIYAMPIVGYRQDDAFTSIKFGIIHRFSDKAKAIVSYEIATDDNELYAYLGYALPHNYEIYAEYNSENKFTLGISYNF